MASRPETTRSRIERVVKDRADWLEHGLDVSEIWVDPVTDALVLGVRSSVQEAQPLLRAAYGQDTRVHHADPVRLPGRSAESS